MTAYEQSAPLDGFASSGPQTEGYRALFDAIDDGVFVIEFLDGPEGPLSDYRHVEGNRAFRRHSGLSDAIGR